MFQTTNQTNIDLCNDDLVHLEKYEAATVDWTFPILTYMVTKHSILPDVQLHWEGKYRRIEYDAFGNSWVPYFLWAYQYSTNPRYAMTFPDTDPNIASVLLPQIDLEWFRPIQAISNDPIYEVVWLVDSWGKHSATYECLWYPTSRSESLYPPQSPSPSMQRDSCYGETWWNHWSPKFLKVSIPCIFGYVRHMSYFSWEDLTWPDDQDRSIQPDPFPIRPQKPSDFLPSTTLSMCNWRCHGGIQQNMDDQSTAAESSHIMSNHVI